MEYFEDYEVGESFEHGSYKVTAEEIVVFARQYDPQPFLLFALGTRSQSGSRVSRRAHPRASWTEAS